MKIVQEKGFDSKEYIEQIYEDVLTMEQMWKAKNFDILEKLNIAPSTVH